MGELINFPVGLAMCPSRLPVAPCDVTRLSKVFDAPMSSEENRALEDLKQQFQSIAKVSDDYAINAAQLVKQMRTLVENGAAGAGVTWFSWARRLGLPPQRILRYLRIADAPNPQKMRDEFLLQDRERAKKSRLKQKQIDPDRARLIAWARKASFPSVTYVLGVIEKGHL